MSNQDYTPPKIWQWQDQSSGKFSDINRPTAGAREEIELQAGKHPLQLYSLATPNGVKVTIMLEELLALGHSAAEYDAWPVNILSGEQFNSGFVDINPNSKIPALVDQSVSPSLRLFESGSILLYLAEKFNALLAADTATKTETLNWLFWQMGSAPFVGGGFGHFYSYAPTKIEYAIDRYAMETKRQLDVLDQRLAENTYIAGNDYSIADIAIWPWHGALALGYLYGASEFLQTNSYKNLMRWSEMIADRPAVQRGQMVNRTWGPLEGQLHERHDSSDFENKTQNLLAS